MRSQVLLFSLVVSFLLTVNSVFAAFTVSVDVSKSLTENEQATVTATVTNPSGSSTESNIVTTLSSGTSWFSVVTNCATIDSLSAGASRTVTCIIKPTSTGSGLTLTAASESQGGTTGSGSASGINVASQSSSLTASITSDSSVATSATFYVGVTVTAPSANDVVNARATISESGQCTVDTSYVAAQQNLQNITKGTSKSPTNWKLTSSSSSGTCTVTVNVVSDVGGSASPSKSITVGTSSTDGTGGTSGGSAGGGGGGAASAIKVTIGDRDAVVKIPSIAANAESNFSIASPVLAVTGMKVKVVNTVTNVQITATKLDSRPGKVVSDAPGVVNQYLEIAKTNISDADVESVTIDFKVEKSWMETNNINADTIALHRYNEKNDQWSKLDTTKISEDSENISYRAASPGLSVFAITGESKSVAPGEILPTGEEPIAERPAVLEIIKKDYWKIILVVAGFAIAVGGLVYFFKIKAIKRKIKPIKK